MTVVLILALVALILGAVAVIQSQGRSLTGWGVVALAAIHLVGALA